MITYFLQQEILTKVTVELKLIFHAEPVSLSATYFLNLCESSLQTQLKPDLEHRKLSS